MTKYLQTEIPGVRLRRNYATRALYTVLAFAPPFLLVLVLLHLLDGTLTAAVFAEALGTLLLCWSVPTLPLLLLALLFRFLPGRVVCVLNDKGIYHADGVIYWGEVTRIEYDIQPLGRYRNDPCSATVYRRKGGPIELEYAPLRLLRVARRLSPGVRATLNGSSKFLLILLAAAELLLPLFALIAA